MSVEIQKHVWFFTKVHYHSGRAGCLCDANVSQHVTQVFDYPESIDRQRGAILLPMTCLRLFSSLFLLPMSRFQCTHARPPGQGISSW
jgi:hypothetical protein